MELLAEERQTGATSGGTEPTPILLIPNRLASTGNALFGIASLGCCVVSSDSYVPQESTIEKGVSVSFAQV